MSLERTGNTQMSLKKHSNNKLLAIETTLNKIMEIFLMIFQISFESMYGSTGSRSRQTKFRGQDLNAELHLNLKDVYKSQKQTLTVNGKNIRLTFPAGIENGQVIKLTGHGTPGANGGPNGDLYITFSINNDTPFKKSEAIYIQRLI